MKRQSLYTVEEARDRIATGVPILVAGDETLLDQLPRGNWIGGTIPYFIGDDGGCRTESRLHLVEIKGAIGQPRVQLYDEENLHHVAMDAPENGLSLIIIPAGCDVHRRYAEKAAGFEGMFLKPIAGWIAGVGLDQLDTVSPKVFDGTSGTKHADRAVVMHLALPAEKIARVEIVSLFEPAFGDSISFPEDGFTIRECIVDGETWPFAAYLAEHGVDTRLPLVRYAAGEAITTSFECVDLASGAVTCYAPVFKDVEYWIAKPVTDYAGAFAAAIPAEANDAVFACNCILNYVYGELEGKFTGDVRGPMTFGEIAYHQLLNQTLVYVTIDDIDDEA